MNNQTVVGVFDTPNQAKTAKRELIDAGFDKSYIDLSTYGEHGTRHAHYEDDDSKVENFFERLFGTEDHDRVVAAKETASRGTVVTVQTNSMDKAKRAAAILDRYGAIDFDERYTQYKNKSFDADRNRTELNKRFGDVNQTIDVVKEEVAIGKRTVETGSGVTVRSRIVEKPVEETLRLRREEVFVNRTKVDRPADTADLRDKTITLTEKAEEAVVSKDARVVEEINVGKKVDTRTETIRETVKETEVDIDRTGHKTTDRK